VPSTDSWCIEADECSTPSDRRPLESDKSVESVSSCYKISYYRRCCSFCSPHLHGQPWRTSPLKKPISLLKWRLKHPRQSLSFCRVTSVVVTGKKIQKHDRSSKDETSRKGKDKGNTVPVNVIKVCRVYRCRAPLIHYLGARWRWVFNITHRPLYPR